MERQTPSKKEFWAYFSQDDDFFMGLSDIAFRTCFHAKIHHNLEIQVKLIYPVACSEGLRFAIREGGRTVGSGQITKLID